MELHTLHHTETSLACHPLSSHCYYCVINSNVKVRVGTRDEVGVRDYAETVENVHLEQLMMGFYRIMLQLKEH